jgi:hypothetical protein
MKCDDRYKDSFEFHQGGAIHTPDGNSRVTGGWGCLTVAIVLVAIGALIVMGVIPLPF